MEKLSAGRQAGSMLSEGSGGVVIKKWLQKYFCEAQSLETQSLGLGPQCVGSNTGSEILSL